MTIQVPNADWIITDDKIIEVFANQPLKTGEEVFISYSTEIDNAMSSRRQNSVLRMNYGFTCRCAACGTTPEQQDASDMRRRLIAELY